MQNEKTLQQMIREYETQMPPEIMNIINSFDWKKEVRMIVNQNQLMLDVGSDLEESVYLMILGIVDIEKVFERMMEVHELPQDKVQKILLEVERQVFEPMHAKLSQLEPVESNQEQPSLEDVLQQDTPPPPPSSPFELSKSEGIRQPFSINTNNSVTIDNNKEQDVSNDPMSQALNQQIVSEPQIVNNTPDNSNSDDVQTPNKQYAVDPYREPIE